MRRGLSKRLRALTLAAFIGVGFIEFPQKISAAEPNDVQVEIFSRFSQVHL